MAYSVDFRQKAIEFMDKGHTNEELFETFGIYYSRIIAWRKLQKDTGSLGAQYRKTRKRKIDLDVLNQALESNPDATLAELSGLFNCTETAIFYALKRAKITLKKKILHTKKSPQ